MTSASGSPFGNFLLASQIQGGTGTINYYITPFGNNSNDGSAPDNAHAWASLANAASVTSRILNDLGYSPDVNINIAPGSYIERKQSVFSSYYGWLSPTIYILSTSGLTNDVIIQFTNYEDGAQIWAQSTYLDIYGITLICSVRTEWFVGAAFGGFVDLYSCTFGSTIDPGYGNSNTTYLANTPFINVYDPMSTALITNCTFSGNAECILQMLNGGTAKLGGTITFAGMPKYIKPAFDVECGANCTFEPGASFVGSFIGQRYLAQLNGTINTYGGGPNYIPGTIAGVTASGGQYI